MPCEAWGWKGLYYVVKNYADKCRREMHAVFLVMTRYAGDLMIDGHGGYEVIARCGWYKVYPEYSFAVCGLTKEQAVFLDVIKPKERAILCIGDRWIGLKQAIKKALECGCELESGALEVIKKELGIELEL